MAWMAVEIGCLQAKDITIILGVAGYSPMYTVRFPHYGKVDPKYIACLPARDALPAKKVCLSESGACGGAHTTHDGKYSTREALTIG